MMVMVMVMMMVIVMVMVMVMVIVMVSEASNPMESILKRIHQKVCTKHVSAKYF